MGINNNRSRKSKLLLLQTTAKGLLPMNQTYISTETFVVYVIMLLLTK